MDYFVFFLAGTLGGWILIFFLNHQTSTTTRQMLLIAFLLASPIALTVMIVGGLLGWPGVFFLPQVPWGLLTWLGSLTARSASKL